MRAGPGGASKASSFRSRCLKFHNFVPADQASHRGGSDSTRLQEQHGTKKITVASTSWLSGVQPVPHGQPPQCMLLAQQNCRSPERVAITHHTLPHPIGSIVPAVTGSGVTFRAPLTSPPSPVALAPPISCNLYSLLHPAPFAPTTHLTPEVTITPIVGQGAIRHKGNNNSSDSCTIAPDSLAGDTYDSDLRKRKSEDVRRLLNLKISRKDFQKTQREEQPLDLSLKRDVSEVSGGNDDDVQIVGIEPGHLGAGSLVPRPIALYAHLGSSASSLPHLGQGLHLSQLPFQLPLSLPSQSSMNPPLTQQLAVQSQGHLQGRLPPPMDAGSRSPAVCLDAVGSNHDRLSSGILVKTKQISESGGATFCKFRQVKPGGPRPTVTRAATTKAKRFHFVQSRWPTGQHRPPGNSPGK
ncbi:uncharacterized protein LOC111244808 isoform X2 [Varroa destructor]|uniref:Uncharacterized protein n=1 Tax=Varroa destructor TaxID=109461 RepID=A0A7M7MAJ6_VARDE|nr:uncharacterized protein LOC111244808 isoform X2 [Varroa destructor]